MTSHKDILDYFQTNYDEFAVIAKNMDGEVAYLQQETSESGVRLLLRLLATLSRDEVNMPIRISTAGFPKLPGTIVTTKPGGGGGGSSGEPGDPFDPGVEPPGPIVPIPDPGGEVPVIINPTEPPDPTAEDDPPYAIDLTVSAEVRAGNTVGHSYTYGDHEGAGEGNSPCTLEKGTTSGGLELLASSIAADISYQYKLDDIAHTVRHSVLPVATSGTSPGHLVYREYVVAEPLTNAPTASNVTIDGVSSPNPIVGEYAHVYLEGYSADVVSGSMIPEGDHIWQWQVTDDDGSTYSDIAGENSPNYLITSSLEGLKFRCQARPVAQHGTTVLGALKSSSKSAEVVAASTPASVYTDYWPTSANPTQGWGGETQPRSVSPVKVGKGPHPKAYEDIGETYINYLLTAGAADDRARHISRVESWTPAASTASTRWDDPARAISLAICRALNDAGISEAPSASECAAKAEAYIDLINPAYEVSGETLTPWLTRTVPPTYDYAQVSNWPSGGIGTGGISMQTLAILYAHFKDDISADHQAKAETHALWWLDYSRKFRNEWSYFIVSPISAGGFGFAHNGDGHGQGFHEKGVKNSFLYGALWLLIEFYDATDTDWQDIAEWWGDYVYGNYLPWMQNGYLGTADHGLDISTDHASGNSVDYMRQWYSYHLVTCMVLEKATGEDHWTGYADFTKSFLGKYIYTALYRTIPNTWENKSKALSTTVLGPGWNSSQMRQNKFPVQLEHMMRFNYIRVDDPHNNSLIADVQSGMVLSPTQTFEGTLNPNAYLGSLAVIPWWYFRNPSPTVTDWKLLPLTKAFPSGGHTVCRSDWDDDADASWMSFRSGEVRLHHSAIWPGDVIWYHRGWALPRTTAYEMNFQGAHIVSANYNGIHIFDPNDPSNDMYLNWAVAVGTQNVTTPVETLRDGGGKRLFDPWTYDTGHGGQPGWTGLPVSERIYNRSELDTLRHYPESNNDLEQNRERQDGSGTVSGVAYRYKSLDWTPMFTKWDASVDYNGSGLAPGSTPGVDARYHGLSRTTRVTHPNGYVRVIVWLDPGGGAITAPPALIVYDQVEQVDATHPIELWWCTKNAPVNSATNYWIHTDQGSVTNAISMDWEDTYYANGEYHNDCILHMQFWDGDTSLSATAASDVKVQGGPTASGGEGESHVIEDGALSGNPAIPRLDAGGPEYNAAQWPWDPTKGPMELSRYYTKIAPAPTSSANKRFLTVMNTDVNTDINSRVSTVADATAVGKYTTTVTDNGSTIDVEITIGGGTRTVEINTTTFAVAVT